MFKYATESGIFEASIGNLKIGKDTLIFNMGSATNCASGTAGVCDLFNTRKCYALKSERRFPASLVYRNRQETYWLEASSFEIVEAISAAFSANRKTKLKYVRLNEAGDLHSVECLEKLRQIASMLPAIKFYTYTHRSDLINDNTHESLPKNLVINTSNFKVNGLNQFAIDFDHKVRSLKRDWKSARDAIRAVKGSGTLSCIGDCSKCSLCKVGHGKTIWLPLH